MSSRFVYPHMEELHAEQEAREAKEAKETALSQTASHQNALGRAKSAPKTTTAESAMASPARHQLPTKIKSIPQPPQRRHFVFADPVAFRYIFTRLPY
jgi:hypothetical protein